MYILVLGGIMDPKYLERIMKSMLVLSLLLCVVSSFAGTALVDSGLGLIFPQELGGLGYDQAVKYDAEDFGYRVSYKRGESFSASITICNLGFSSIPEGHEGEGVDLVFQTLETNQKLRVKSGEISDFRKRGSSVVPREGRIRFSNRGFQFLEPRESAAKPVKRTQLVYVAAVRNQLIKLDFTFDQVEGKKARGMSEKMLEQLMVMLQAQPNEQTLVMAACEALLLDPSGYGGRVAAQQVIAANATSYNVNIYPELFAWPTSYYRRPKNSELLQAAYVAGAIQGQEAGDESNGLAAMLSAYQTLRAKEQIKSIEKLDEWVAAPDKKALFDQLMVEFRYRLLE